MQQTIWWYRWCHSGVFQVHKEAHYKNTTTPVKNSKEDEDTPLHINIESYKDEESNDVKIYNDDNEESALEDMDENDTDSLNDTSDVAGQDVMRFSMSQDNFIEDSPLAMARVIWRKLIGTILREENMSKQLRDWPTSISLL